jgi:hypothetical protein
MTALQAGYRLKEREQARTRFPPVAAATVCWEGGMVALSGAGTNAVAVPAAANAALRVIGVADATADNRLGVAGAMTVETRTGTFAMNNSVADPVTVGDIGANCYAADDNTVSHSNGGNTQPVAGAVFDIDPSGLVWVKFS